MVYYVSLLAGQLAMSLVFDSRGFYGFKVQAATPLRISGADPPARLPSSLLLSVFSLQKVS